MALSAVWISVASLLATFDIEKAMDENGNVMEPTHEYLSALVTYAIFFPPVCLLYLTAKSECRNPINVQSNLAQRKRKPSSALLHTKKSFNFLYDLIIWSSFPSNMIYLPSVQLFFCQETNSVAGHQILVFRHGTTAKHSLIYRREYYGTTTHTRQILAVFIDFFFVFSLTISFSLIEMTPAYYPRGWKNVE